MPGPIRNMKSDLDAIKLHPKTAIPEDLVLINPLRLSCRLGILSCLLLLALCPPASAQNCAVPQANSDVVLPAFSGTIAGDAISTGSGNDYVYVLTQWGFARGSLAADPGNPAGFNQVIIAEEPGSGSGGLIQVTCDCHHGGTLFDVAEAPDGSARLISNYTARDSRLTNAELVRADGSGSLRFGQQVFSGTIRWKPTAIYLPSSGKYIGYVSTSSTTEIFDLTTTTGSLTVSSALRPIMTFPWVAPQALRAARVTGSGFDKFLLAGYYDGSTRVAVLDPVTGIPAEIGAIASGVPETLFWGVVSDRVFLVGTFPNDSTPSLKIFEFHVGTGALSLAYQINGGFIKAVFRGNSSLQFPALLAHRVISYVPPREGYIDIYDTKFLTQGGVPQLAGSLPHEGASVPFQSPQFDAIVRSTGSTVSAYVYRLVYVPPPDGSPTLLPSVYTDKVDISCIGSDPNAPPAAAATCSNQTENTNCTSGVNYYGDKFLLTDRSSSDISSPITSVNWDFNYNSPFRVDQSFPSSGSTPTVYFPCRTPAGLPATGLGCQASVVPTVPVTPPGNGSYQFALQATNRNGTTAFQSPSITLTPPQVRIVGLTGTTLNILTGGTADARQTQGNINDPATTFAWTFTPAGTSTLQNPVVPLGATGFALVVTYPGGYQAAASGTISQRNLVGDFTTSPNPVLINATLTATNSVQKSAAVTISSVEFSITTSPETAQTFSGTGHFVASSFFGTVTSTAVTGSAPIPAPSTKGTYYLNLRYNYSPSDPTALVVSHSFIATDFAPNPIPDVALDSGGLQGACPFTPCSLTTNTTYYLFDRETIPGTIPQPDRQWAFVTGSGSSSIGTSVASAGPLTWTTPGTTCLSNCSLKVTVGSALKTLAVTLSNPAPPPPPPPPASLTVSISGPTSVNLGQAATFTANVSGGAGPFTYSWFFDDNPIPVGGPATVSHSWSSNGSHSMSLSVTNGTSSGQATWTISVVGNPVPSGALSISPSQQTDASTYLVGRGQEVTMTAAETNASQWGWDFGDQTLAGGPTSRSVKKTYGALGTYSARLDVYGDNVHTTGLTMTNFTVVVGLPFPSAGFTATGATQNPGTLEYQTEVGRTLTFAASEPSAQSFSWDFGDGSPVATGRTATHSYSSTGRVSVHLAVAGDGVNTGGTTTGTAVFNVGPTTFRAVIVPGAARLDDGTTTWGTDVSVTNAGTTSMNIGLAFLPWDVGPPTRDLSQLDYVSPDPIGAGGSYSVSDVVAALGKAGQGTLVVKYSGGGQTPLVSTRVYFRPKVNPSDISYGSGLSAYNVDGAGNVSPQGFVSAALSSSPGALSTESTAEALDLSITVNLTGTGSGTVTSVPAGISCPPTCSASIPAASVTLSGLADAGSRFIGITGCDNYPVGVCTVESNKTVTARFDTTGQPPPGTFTLSVTKAGTGTGTVSSNPAGISCGGTCSASFAQGTTVALTATPDSGFSFAGWSGACSGTGACSVTLSANASVTATFSSSATPPPQQGDQVLIGMRSDPRYRFIVNIFNAAGSQGNFELRATDDQGRTVLVLDDSRNLVAVRKFNNLGPFQQVYLRDSDLGLDDGKHYVLKATATKGTLLAFGTALDKKTNDLVQISDDSQASPAEDGIVSYWVAGVSRINSTAHWRTDLRIFNRGSSSRNLYFEYFFIADGIEHRAHVDKVPIAAGTLLTYDDVIGSLLSQDTGVDLSGDNAGILRVYYGEDSDSTTHPLVIGSRNYDDEPTGTAGSQLAVYTSAQAGGASRNLFLTGVEDSVRYSSRIGVFTMDPGPVTGRIVAVGPDGTPVGSVGFTLGGSSPRYGQLSLTDPNMNFNNPGKPVSIRFEDLKGGRVGAYAFTVDKVTLDTNFIQALPQN